LKEEIEKVKIRSKKLACNSTAKPQGGKTFKEEKNKEDLGV